MDNNQNLTRFFKIKTKYCKILYVLFRFLVPSELLVKRVNNPHQELVRR